MIGPARAYDSWQELALGGGGLSSGFAEYNNYLSGVDAVNGRWSALWEARDMWLQPVAGVAEPGSLLLAGLSLMGFFAVRCRRVTAADPSPAHLPRYEVSATQAGPLYCDDSGSLRGA